MMIKRAKNIKFDEFNFRKKKKFDFQNLKEKKSFLNIVSCEILDYFKKTSIFNDLFYSKVKKFSKSINNYRII